VPNPTGLHICLLGQATFSVDGEPITDVATRKAEALLLYLACNPRPHRREVLSELLWDDLRPERALGNVRLVLNQLRPRFARFLAVTRYTVALRDDVPCWLDVDALEQGIAGDEVALAEALALYRGDFLQGFHLRDARGFSEWQLAQAEHWRSVTIDGMRRLIEHHVAWSRYAEGLNWAKRLLAIDPLDEAAHRQAMLLLARSGQRHAVARQYQRCAQLLRTELGLEPEPATTMLYERIVAGLEQRLSALPPQAGPLIGRAAELAHVYTWLATPAARLLTIAGPGGSGKTQLALSAGWRVATERLGPCDDGVFYLALVGHSADLRVSDDELLLALARVLGLQLSARATLADQVGRCLQDRALLLIVDNGELLRESARLALSSLLHQAPALRVLVPSRERLRLRDEHVLELDGLAYPAPPAPADGGAQEPAVSPQLAGYAAVQLLLHHVGREQGPADVSSYGVADQHALEGICQLVHGLPLAIELAAPWLALRSPRELLQSITETIDVLQADTPDLPQRHRSIRAVFDYSWRLLPQPEAQALAGLGVFPASFTAGAAKAVVGAGLATLAALRDKSLVQALRGEPETRYALHPLLQRFALEKLQADDLVEAQTRARHAEYFAAFAQERERQLYGPESPAAMSAIEREFENLRAGWYWAVQLRDVHTLGQYSVPLHDFCALRGWKLESHRLFGAGAAAARAWAGRGARDDAASLAAVRVLSCYAELQQTLGAVTAAAEAYHECRIILNAIAAEDAPELLFVYKQIGLLAYGRGAYPEAMQYLRLTLAIAEEGDDRVRVADTLLSIGAVAIAQGAWATAEQALRRGLAIYEDLQYAWGRGHTLRFLGALALATDGPAAAQGYLEDSLASARQIGNRVGEALALNQLGVLYLAQGQLERSADVLSQALALFEELGVELGVGRALGHLGRLALVQGRRDQARQLLLRAMALAEQLPSPPLLIECAASALHQLWSEGASQALAPLAAALGQHPACTAETRGQLAARIAPDSEQELPPLALEELIPAIRGLLGDVGLAQTVSGHSHEDRVGGSRWI
jgi:DNA-binding SARP family transcriptional activator/predicted ATPase